VVGSIAGSALGSQLVGIVPAHVLMIGLGGILLLAAYKVFSHAH